MLVKNISRPTRAEDGATVAVMLHGRGSHRGDLQALHPLLPADWFLVTPQAPHPGHPWGYGPGWAWYRYLAEDQVDAASLDQSLQALDGFLTELPDILGIVPGTIALGGFSQGGTLSMCYALSRPGVVSGVLNFSGFLPSHTDPADGDAGQGVAPIFWGHGLRDPSIPYALAERGRARLRSAGVRVEARDYDIGHWIAEDEIRHAVDFVTGVG
jgi:phospholipase/carboxylesterase